MTLAQAQACGAAASNAGFDAALIKITPTTWKVRVTANDLIIDVTAAASLATAQGVIGKIALIEYV